MLCIAIGYIYEKSHKFFKSITARGNVRVFKLYFRSRLILLLIEKRV